MITSSKEAVGGQDLEWAGVCPGGHTRSQGNVVHLGRNLGKNGLPLKGGDGWETFSN